jgi:hypothetical protein
MVTHEPARVENLSSKIDKRLLILLGVRFERARGNASLGACSG